MNRFLIDTDVLIDHLRGVEAATSFLEQRIKDDHVYISAITVSELFSGVRDGQEKSCLEQFLKLFNLVAIEQAVAIKGGLFRRDYGKSHGVGLADAIISASADSVAATLVTLNKKHFPMQKNILIPYQKKSTH